MILIAELPDKSMFATLILSQRLPKWWVWLGAASAFLVHVIIAVTAGKLLTFLPRNLLDLIVAVLFLGGAALVFFGKHRVDGPAERKRAQNVELHNFWKVFGTAFGIVFIGEWGDITQIITANYAASYHDALSVAVGAVLGLWAATTVAVVAGGKALEHLPAKLLQRVTASVLLLFGIINLVNSFRG